MGHCGPFHSKQSCSFGVLGYMVSSIFLLFPLLLSFSIFFYFILFAKYFYNLSSNRKSIIIILLLIIISVFEYQYKCHQKIPLLNEIHKNFTEDVVVIGLTDENPDKVKNWLTNRNVEYYIGVDADAKYRNQIGIQGIWNNNFILFHSFLLYFIFGNIYLNKGTPNVLVIDKEGVVQWQVFYIIIIIAVVVIV